MLKQCLSILVHYFIVFFKHKNKGYKFQNVLKIFKILNFNNLDQMLDY
jgi:hypothetical protein